MYICNVVLLVVNFNIPTKFYGPPMKINFIYTFWVLKVLTFPPSIPQPKRMLTLINLPLVHHCNVTETAGESSMTLLVEQKDAQPTAYRFGLNTLKADPVKDIVN